MRGSAFIPKMAWRDSRASRWRLLLFSISITLGIAALVALGSFRRSLAQAIDEQARTLIGADLIVHECTRIHTNGGNRRTEDREQRTEGENDRKLQEANQQYRP